MNPNHARMQKHFYLSSQLAQTDDEQLSKLFDNSEQATSWARHQVLEIAGNKLFVKRIPLTEIEAQNHFSTQNLYNLPPYYHYGLGSVGLGVYRELIAHIKASNWVLQGEIESFPLLYHYRIMPFAGEREEIDMERHQRYVAYWGGNEQVSQYMLDRANARLEMVLFLEYIPHTLQPWLQEHPEQIEWVFAALHSTLDFLWRNGVIHFDAHFENALTDGERVYLTDFGLVLDRSFSLSEDEVAFFDSHTTYDYGHLFWNLISPIFEQFKALPKQTQLELNEKYGLSKQSYFHTRLAVLFENIGELHSSGVIKVNEVYLAYLLRYQRILALLGKFYSSLQNNPQKDTPFPDKELRRLLDDNKIQKRLEQP